MHYLITGATGFIGSHYCRHLTEKGVGVTALVRSIDKAAKVLPPSVTLIDSLDALSNQKKIDCILNLAGAPIAARPWTKSRRSLLLNSRVSTTEKLVALVTRLSQKPSLFISASAAGYYGRRDAQPAHEEDSPQDIFMSQLCAQWEAAAAPVTDMGVRLVIPRISVVLGPGGGALPKLVLPHRFGIGAKIGTGDHYFPWIHLEDLCRFFDFAADNPAVNGPYNMVTRDNHTQHSFNQHLAAALGRPYFMAVPKGVLRLMMGEMADLFSEGQHMSADKLYATGWQPQFPTLKAALTDIMQRP